MIFPSLPVGWPTSSWPAHLQARGIESQVDEDCNQRLQQDGRWRTAERRTSNVAEKGEIPPWRIGDSTGAVSMLMRQTPWISGWIPPKDQLRTSRDCMGQMTQSEGFLILSPSKSPQPLPSGNETRQLKWIKSSTNLSKSQTYFTKLFQARPTMDDKPRSTACFPSASVAVGFTKPKKRNMSKPSGPRWFVTREVRFPKGRFMKPIWYEYYGWLVLQPLWKIFISQLGWIFLFPICGNIKFMFQTTNQSTK